MQDYGMLFIEDCFSFNMVDAEDFGDIKPFFIKKADNLCVFTFLNIEDYLT